jgi:hypothetical protein
MTINTGQINAPSAPISVGGVTLSEFRQRLRIQLSGYAENTLILDTPVDVERQLINDGIGQLWPYDYQVVFWSTLIVASRNVYTLPIDAEHVFEVFATDVDVNENVITSYRIPSGDGWAYTSSFIDATTTTLTDGSTWTDSVKKAIRINDLGYLGQSMQQSTVTPGKKYLVVHYARRWPLLVIETDAIDPSPQRVQAAVHFAAANYFTTQFQVNTESIRSGNYLRMAQTEMQLAQQNLVKDPKTLYML